MSVSAAVLESFGLAGGKLMRFESGLINASWRVDTPSGNSFVLQRVNPMFPPIINKDIDAITRHLRDKGMPTPVIVPTTEGAPALQAAGEVWRVLTYLSGVSRDTLENARQASEAGALLGRFHNAVSDLDHTFSNPRLGVHDTAAHLANLRRTLAAHGDHPQFDKVNPIAERILEMALRLPDLPLTRERIVHGDPKISNFIFDPDTDEGIGLVDLDTVASMPIVLELGDAFRSWCNPLGEDTTETTFSLPFFRAAIGGYARGAPGLLSADEWQALPVATLTIALELAARFAADALQESYFGWDKARFENASHHNRVRAAGQLRVAESVHTQRQALTDAVSKVIGGTRFPMDRGRSIRGRDRRLPPLKRD
ncbi:MAG: phosphotransferase [Rhodospirillaceae bacterium]|nr:phosphotransferase [Rhodospirillaceae bacterium]